MNRVRGGYCLVPNPFNTKQISRVSLAREDVDAIVFWTKNPRPFLGALDELDRGGFRYFFQFTLNAYGRELEPRVPPFEQRIATFRELASRLGPARVVWRYDPIVLSSVTTAEFHLEQFERTAALLSGATRRVVISLADFYRKTDRRLGKLEAKGWRIERSPSVGPELQWLIERMVSAAVGRGMEIFTCAEDLAPFGICPGACVDAELIRQLWDVSVSQKKDPGQRDLCKCVVSRDIGMADTCLHGCAYCYATRNDDLARSRHKQHIATSATLIGQSEEPPDPSGHERRQLKLF